MIVYDKSPFGCNLLARVNGSAAYRATIPGFLAALLVLLIRLVFHENRDDYVRQSYALGVLVGSISFLLVFRVQAAYSRYWEACTTIHSMIGRWLEVATHAASFHRQSSLYDSIRPPSCLQSATACNSVYQEQTSAGDCSAELLNGAWRAHTNSDVSECAPILHRLAHLTSLLTAVAFSTLRGDTDETDLAFQAYIPGLPWPPVDPDNALNKTMWTLQGFLYSMGMARTSIQRQQYNNSRPFSVLGGVSECELVQLRLARGPLAKSQVCCNWLAEFIVREHLAGALGPVQAPHISVLLSLLADGMLQYNSARKVMSVPFPFPHAQLSVMYILLAIPSVALLMDQYVEETSLGMLLSFFTIACLVGIHEVARELENPYRNVPNELPLVTMQAELNESLLTMYAGFHPDFGWQSTATQVPPRQPAESIQTGTESFEADSIIADEEMGLDGSDL